MREGVREGDVWAPGEKDFRSSLFSIFVDNVHPSVDQRHLWDYFKSLGRVRDIFLAAGQRKRRSKFAFVRFTTIEEAEQVVRKSNGTLVSGWRISSKVATFGWEKRRVEGRTEGRNAVYKRGSQGSQGWNSEVLRDDRGSMKTFAEVVSDEGRTDNPGTRVSGDLTDGRSVREVNGVKRADEILWNEEVKDDAWLANCAVGVLRRFDKVTRVNRRLSTDGIRFNTKYLGDKLILWRFDSQLEVSRFIENKVLWEDCFVSMNKWSFSDVAKSRIAWVQCTGVPLCYWNSEFFCKAGEVMGDPLIIDDDTLFKRSLFKGRILILLKNQSPTHKKIIVNCSRGSVKLLMVEEEKPVDQHWIEEFLDLGDGSVDRSTSNSIKVQVGEEMGEEGENNQLVAYGDHTESSAGRGNGSGGINQRLMVRGPVSKPFVERGKLLLNSISKPLQKLSFDIVCKKAMLYGKNTGVGVSNVGVSSQCSKEMCSLMLTGSDFASGPSVVMDSTGCNDLDKADGVIPSCAGLGQDSTPKGIECHTELGKGPTSNLISIQKGRIRKSSSGTSNKEAKRIQLMMKKGLFRASLVSMRSDHQRNPAANRLDVLRKRERKIVERSVVEEIEGVIGVGIKEGQVDDDETGNGCIPGDVPGIEDVGCDNGSDLVEDDRVGIMGEEDLEEEINKVCEIGNLLGLDFGANNDSVREEIRRRELEDAKRFRSSVT